MIGFKVSSWRGYNSDYNICTIEIFPIVANDAGRELVENLGRPYQESYVKRAAALKELTGGTEYYSDGGYRTGLSVTFQSNRDEPRRWYGCRFDDIKMSADALAIAGKIFKAASKIGESEGFTPRVFIAALLAMKARRVRYASEISYHIPDDSTEDFTTEPAPAAEVTTEASAA